MSDGSLHRDNLSDNITDAVKKPVDNQAAGGPEATCQLGPGFTFKLWDQYSKHQWVWFLASDACH